MKILLVEDSPDLAEMYQLALSQAGHEVINVPLAQQALDALDRTPFDLMILDILLPTHNGLNILHELRTYDDWRKLPVIVLSNLSLEEIGLSQELLTELGVVNYLSKSQIKPHQLALLCGQVHSPAKG